MILRFAITRVQSDMACILELAREMDQQCAHHEATSFSYFVRTSLEIYRIIVVESDPERCAKLSYYLGRIDDLRLRRALAAALECPDSVPQDLTVAAVSMPSEITARGIKVRRARSMRQKATS